MAVKALGGIVLAAKSSGKQLARAIRPVPIKLITVSKGIPPGTSAMAGDCASCIMQLWSSGAKTGISLHFADNMHSEDSHAAIRGRCV